DNQAGYFLACDATERSRYLLAPASLQGSDIARASASFPQNSIGTEWQIDLAFASDAVGIWARQTAEVTRLPDVPGCGPPQGCNALALVLDGVVESAPQIVELILGGQAQITGDFTETRASDLAAVLTTQLPTAF